MFIEQESERELSVRVCVRTCEREGGSVCVLGLKGSAPIIITSHPPPHGKDKSPGALQPWRAVLLLLSALPAAKGQPAQVDSVIQSRIHPPA